MSKVSVLIASFESKIKLIEDSIAQATAQVNQWTSNHAGLIGMLQATKEALIDAHKVMDVLDPSSPITEGLNIAENVATVVENAVDAVESPKE